MRSVFIAVIILGVLGAGAFFYAWSGSYNIGADSPHWEITYNFIEML